MKPGSYYAAYFVKKLWATFAVSLVVIAVVLSMLRYSLPYMDGQKHHIETWLSNKFGSELTIGEISANWQGAGPSLVLRNIKLVQNEQSPISLNIGETYIDIDFWGSVVARQVRSTTFDLRSLAMVIDLSSIEQEGSDFPIVEALQDLFLSRLQSFSLRDSSIQINTLRDSQVLSIEQLSWINKAQRHQGVGLLKVDELATNSASFILDLYGEKDALSGHFYAKADEVDLSPWINQVVRTRYELIESRGNFVFWANIQDNKIAGAHAHFDKSQFIWKNEDSQIEAAVLSGKLHASPKEQEWAFKLDDLALQIDQQIVRSSWLGNIDAEGNLTFQNQGSIELSGFTPLMPLLLNAQRVDLLEKLAPRASLDSFIYQLSSQGDSISHLSISDIAWQQSTQFPGIEGLQAQIDWFDKQGRVRLRALDGHLLSDKLLSDNLAYESLSTDLFITHQDSSLVLHAPEFVFQSEGLNLNSSFYYRSIDKFFKFSGLVGSLDTKVLPSLYPGALMGEETKAYLSDAIRSGNVESAQLLWFGSLDAFPFDREKGVFQAAVQLRQTEFMFDSGWPPLSQLDLRLLFENEKLTMFSDSGALLDVKLDKLQAEIPRMTGGAVLNIDIKAKALGQDVASLMQQSSMANSLGKALNEVQISKTLSADLHLHIPLSGDNTVAQGQVTLQNNQIFIPSIGLRYSAANGVVDFRNEEVDFKGVNAELLGQAVTLNFSGKQQEEGYKADIQMQGDWAVATLLEQVHPSLQPYLDGTSQWTAKVNLLLPETGYQYQATIESSLHELSSLLPAPFGKEAQIDMPLLLVAQGNQQASTIKLNLAKNIQFEGNLPHQDMQFSRAHLSIGETDTMGMGIGFSIAIDVPELDASLWYPTIAAFMKDLPESERPLLAAPERILVKADSALVLSQKITDLELLVKNASDNWLLDLNAKQARAKITLYKDWLDRGIDIRADFIDLSDWQGTLEQENPQQSLGNLFKPELAKLPPVKFECLRCRFQDKDLGRIDFALSRAANGMKIDNLRLSNDHGLLNATGDWFLAGEANSTRLNGEFSSTDFGAFLKDFKLNSGIKDSKATADFDLSWNQAPYEFNLASLNGDINWRLSDGYLSEVTDKGSRIFSLLSLESLVRKLSLDFRDVFAKGFFYDKMTGSFQIANGVADTQDTIVDGGAGEITMLGHTDLNQQTLDYRISFAPKVTSSLPVIIAYMVNPATALAALALDQVLTSAKVISNIEFSLTGTIDEPKLEELGRDSKDITLPAQAIPQEQLIVPPIDEETQNTEPDQENTGLQDALSD